MAKRRITLTKRFYFVLIGAVVLIGAAVLLLIKGGQEDELSIGTMRLNHQVKSVIIRDEASMTTERYDRILFNVMEGARVNQGDQIAEVFRWGYQEETMQALLNVEQQILAHQLTQWEGIVKAELVENTTNIEAKQAEIRASISAEEEGADMLKLELELKALLAERAQILSETQADETLSQLYAQQTQQLNNLENWKRNVVAEASGLVSFYFDGYEKSLNTQKLDLVNADLIDSVLKNNGVVSNTDTSSDSPLYRLIDENHFHIAFLTDTADPFRLVQGEEYTVVFAGYADKPFTATAAACVVGEKKVVNLLEFNGQPLGDLAGIRVVEATVMKDVTGFKVPLEAISMQENVPGIVKVAGDENIWTAVNVYAKDENDAIIQAANPADTLVAGLRYKRK
ncbi:hypothetical protein LJC07_01970 [Christensenellaceae bacterium OttesenSCG-928-L17]|nr:hypothetical protein [Christensenellaceae bacterium OttesenSCG-928-L17]